MNALKQKLFITPLIIFSLALIGTILFQTTAYALSAEEYGKKYANENKPKSECGKKFDRSADAAKKAECERAYDKQKAAISGKKGADAKKSMNDRDVCGRYRNETNKKSCESAYKSRVKSNAKKAGKEAGQSGEASPCGSVFEGRPAVADAKQVCRVAYESAYKRSGNEECAGVKTFFDWGCQGASTNAGDEDNPIIRILFTVVNWLAGLVSVVAVGGIVAGGIIYLTAGDNSAQTQKGITFIVNAVLGLIVFTFTWALINFIVPGGLFS